ncbi:hypothetical protein BDV32DRAFT_125070 [Aspergillus pseudonomiae]|uniref:Uncharacterized protein n=1 Tax=Aspergillus pseudonomiae TaxID=1506151 RepID=A0A5N6HYC4_9EURO|nr:uncharacterized protein BDV37DRAFT_249879 [Aspergillus pseudonomiae]KAB8258884.1 hypothetical protein BDV32DRAFT_125070 [Aspergillus pseudonomiae]KAE8403573.1 hypothetical protein BDV37DRAFT_249879 [Aspergillus pseudonomiae]
MPRDSKLQPSQCSLAPPAEISGPVSPTRRASHSASPDRSIRAESHTSRSDRGKFFSPPSLPSSDMTPPPSSQIPGAPLRQSRSRSSSYLASPPDIEKTLCVAYGASENLPTAEEIDTADESKLRAIAKELLGVAQEARMSALHFKLQNSLLSFTSNEAIKRAEVEHKLARREVEILQSSEYRRRHSETKPPQQIANVELELALKRNQELERVNATLDRRLRRAKKLIDQEKVKSDRLGEENSLLKDRIRDNRKHLSLMIEHGSLSPSPQNEIQTPHRKSVPHFADNSHHMTRDENHNPFAALLAADRVLNRESPSAISTSNQNGAQQQFGNHHVRGAHSLSSLPMTPSRSRVAQQESQHFTPNKDSQHQHRDRDSTISASDTEGAETEDDAPSRTGSVATNMFRHGHSDHQNATRVANAPKSSTLLQTTLFGQVRKAGVVQPSGSLKRKASFDSAASKKLKAEERVGLGIDTWNNNSRP